MIEKQKNSDLPDNTNPGFSSQKAGQKKAKKEQKQKSQQGLDSHGWPIDEDHDEKL